MLQLRICLFIRTTVAAVVVVFDFVVVVVMADVTSTAYTPRSTARTFRFAGNLLPTLRLVLGITSLSLI